MPRSRSRSRSPRRRRELDREDRDSYYRRDDTERDRRRREDVRFAGDRRKGDRDSERRPHSRERYGDSKRDNGKYRERSRSQRNSRPPRYSRSPSRSGSPSAAADSKGKPNFKPSGLLAAETNTVKKTDGTSIVLKYNEPPEARRPTQSWRLYVFKGKEQLGKMTLYFNLTFFLSPTLPTFRAIAYLSTKCLPHWKRPSSKDHVFGLIYKYAPTDRYR